MSSWSFVRSEMLLFSGSKPIEITTSKRCRYDPAPLFRIMDLLKVPAAYTWGLDEIRLTRLNSLHGEYDPSQSMIRLSTDSFSRDFLDRFFIHELGHHVDERLNVSSSLKGELATTQEFISTSWIKNSVEEYFASGLEIFYAGWEHEVELIKKNHPKLFSSCREVHKKYAAMSLR